MVFYYQCSLIVSDSFLLLFMNGYTVNFIYVIIIYVIITYDCFSVSPEIECLWLLACIILLNHICAMYSERNAVSYTHLDVYKRQP